MIARSLVIAAAAFLIAAPSAGAQAQAITGADAWRTVVGNTIIGVTATGEALVEYFAPNGVVKNKIDGEPRQGEWTLRGDRVCTNYSGDDDDEAESDDSSEEPGDDEEADCYALSLQGGALTLTDDSGKAREFRILPGNAEKL